MRRTRKQKLFYYSRPGLYRLTIEELKTVEERVLWLLRRRESFRNNDMSLIWGYWRIFDNLDTTKLDAESFKKLTSPESIRRVRQKIQNDYGLWLPTTKEVLEARKIKESAVRDWAYTMPVIMVNNIVRISERF